MDINIKTIFEAYDLNFCGRNKRISDPLTECRYDLSMIRSMVPTDLLDDSGLKIISEFNPDLIGGIGPDSLYTGFESWDRTKLYSKSKESKSLNKPSVSIDRIIIGDHDGLLITYYELALVLVHKEDADLITFLSYDGFSKGQTAVVECLAEFYRYIIKDYFNIKFK